MQVRVVEQARRDVRAALLWWKTNRPAAPGGLEIELSTALSQIKNQPRSGPETRYPGAKGKGFRRMALNGARYFVYYRVDEAKQEVVVLRLWHMSRRHRPKLP